MKAADHDVRETDPFADEPRIAPVARSPSPIVARLRTLWAAAREVALAELPRAPGPPSDGAAYLRRIDDTYQLDAYHSLSIEGYRVSPESPRCEWGRGVRAGARLLRAHRRRHCRGGSGR